MKPDSPDNMLARLPRQISLETRIKSVSLLDDGQALVRYDLVQNSFDGGESRPVPFVSVIRYRFRDRPLAESDRFINPLGFEVVRYRKDPEAAPAGDSGVSASMQIAAPPTAANSPPTVGSGVQP